MIALPRLPDQLSPVWFMHVYLFILLILNVIDVGVFHTGGVKPAFFMIGLFSVLLLRPAIMPQIIVFLFGLLLDCLTGVPLGFYALQSLLLAMIIDNGRRYLHGQSWHVVWAGFILSYVALVLFEIILWSWIGQLPMDVIEIAGKIFMSAISFPILFLPFLWIDRWAKQKEA